MTDNTPKTSVDQNEIRYLGDVQRLELRPGDIIVLRLSEGLYLTDSARENLKQVAESQLPGHKIIILEDGFQIGILSPVNGEHGDA
mgnify:CR=1 FL=1